MMHEETQANSIHSYKTTKQAKNLNKQALEYSTDRFMLFGSFGLFSFLSWTKSEAEPNLKHQTSFSVVQAKTNKIIFLTKQRGKLH